MKFSMFNEEEMQMINRVAAGVSLEDLVPDALIGTLNTTIAVSTDEQIIEFCKMLKAKIIDMSQDEWNNMTYLLPFNISASDDDDTSQVPDDAYEDIEEAI